ncbi:hypothetical protein [Amycolatopsis thermoflava]|uniref:hypothetical protein n=1 Tax=Amycolatopsis thermoflava TaxID=84480 RepID=UPI003D73AD7E
MRPAERDSFANLLLLCLAHHAEVEDDEKRYPPEELKRWKTAHEGAQNSVLNRLTVLNADGLMRLLTEIAEPPLNRLEAITKRLEQTGEVTAETLTELKQVIATMADTSVGVDAHSARILSFAAEVFGNGSFNTSVSRLADAAQVLPSVVDDLNKAAARMEGFR